MRQPRRGQQWVKMDMQMGLEQAEERRAVYGYFLVAKKAQYRPGGAMNVAEALQGLLE